MITADQILVKQINKSLVLNYIRKKEHISRADIAKKTGLNRSTVSALVDELITEGLIVEKGIGTSKGGRKPVILAINKNGGSIIGVDLGVNYILTVLTDLLGKIIWEKRIPIDPQDPPEKNIDLLINMIGKAKENAPDTLKGILGIGIGVPGIVNYEKGLVLMAPNLKWENVNLKDIIEEKLNIPVFIDNEANTGAIGEKWFGLGKKATNFVYVSAGIGVGTGIIINDELYRGSSGLAGEMGHMTIDMNGKPCSCDNTGCWEEYASEKALFKYLRDQVSRYTSDSDINRENIDTLTIFDIVDAAKAGDDLAVSAFRLVGKHLGIGVAGIINTFNPDLVIIGNTISLAGDIVMQEITEEVSKRSFITKYSEVTIAPSHLNMHACAMGAVTLVMSRVFASPNI
ncbi:ROK family transcriptional regulator [Biomaibacter acetigenes]|jgi:glucokinase-like ROK family protein|uniref:ROK family transcriptional regulator n=1 Tax=Biomaibacter acetigenes TaxID=2316383 RepID=A0A3G2R3Q5_9FIRM|nr:ROK family transcriptional regulator [Biomaibacter acetigenes]AYO29965.1 ROK family transcriptional regulator [Biomaibacter acetigenes]